MEEHLSSYAIILFVLFNIGKTFFKEKNEDLKASIEAHNKNTIALGLLSERIDRLARFPEDVNQLGLSVRELRTKVEFLEKRADREV